MKKEIVTNENGIIKKLNEFGITKPILEEASKMDINVPMLFYDKIINNPSAENIDNVTKNLLGVYGNYLATHYFKMQGYDVENEVGVYDNGNGNLLTRADISFIDSNGIRNYCEVKAAYQIIDNIRNYKDNSLEKTGYYKDLDAEIIKYKKIGEKLIKQVKKLSKDGSLVNVIIFDGCYMDEIIKQELKKLGANIITLNVNIYDLEENIKKNVLRILSYFSKNVTINIDYKGKKNR